MVRFVVSGPLRFALYGAFVACGCFGFRLLRDIDRYAGGDQLSGFRVEGDRLVVDPSVRVRFGERYGADEFAGEDGAFLISPALAREIEASVKPPTSPEPPKPPPKENEFKETAQFDRTGLFLL